MIELSREEARVVGALMEKEVTTPDQYPLTLKGLTVACNQKSNREPVMSLSESEVQSIVDDLKEKNLVAEVLFGGRVPKYKHRFCNTEFSKLHLNKREFGVICVMLLRGAQTPGELRTRTNRMCNFDHVQDVDATLERLASREEGALVQKLEREPGQRESRFIQLFSPTDIQPRTAPSGEASVSASTRGQGSEDHEQRICALENEVSALREELESLKAQWKELVE